MSGLVTGLQNRLRRFESARHLTSERYPLPQRISFFFIPNRYFSRCGRRGRLGTPALDGVLDGVLAGVLDGVLIKHGFGWVGQISLRGEVRSCGVLPSRQMLMCLGLSVHISTSFRCTPVTHGSAFQAPERYV